MNQELSFGSIVREHRLGLPERTLVVKYQSRLETALLSLTQAVMDFAPGMWSSLSSPGGGQGLATVLEDAVTVR